LLCERERSAGDGGSRSAQMASQQAERAAELQDPEVRTELDRRVREEGETVVKSGGGGTTLDAQERLAEGEPGRGRPFLLRSVHTMLAFD
jgi:hypothetical protein